MTDALQRLVDESEIRRIRRLWAFARDQGDWDTVATLFHPEATVSISWYAGSAAGFIAASRRMFVDRPPETRSKHWFGNDRLALAGTRATLETDIEVRTRDDIDGKLFDFTYEGRFFDRFEMRDGAWKIAQWTCLYDCDRVNPVVPSAIPPDFFAGLELSGFESRVAYMRLRQRKTDRPAAPSIVIGGTEAEATLKREAAAWLAQGAR
ncbi:MAG TPA: nuclear transport factor 2 family protein [Stellaceae bacterium]|nr:nuclear transport factor 2 family protein [Stellaceae bacterium]